MAQRKVGSVAAPAKQKLRKNHGPKRKLFHDWSKVARADLAQAGLLTKYYNYESFVLSCGARGIKTGTAEMWAEFSILTRAQQDDYLRHIKENSIKVTKKTKK